MSAPRACSWEKARGWLCPGRNSSGLLISARPADRCLILPAVPRGRKSSAAGPGRTWQALGHTPCRLAMGFQHPGFEPSHFPAPPPAARCRGEAPAAHLPPAPAGCERGLCRGIGGTRGCCGQGVKAWAWPGELGHGLGSVGMAWGAWAWPGELGHRLGSSGIAWRVWASPAAPQAGGAMLRALAQMPLAEGGTACPRHPSPSASQPRAKKAQTLPKEHRPEPGCPPRIPQSLGRHAATSPGLPGEFCEA